MSFKTVEEIAAANAARRYLLDETARDGARQMVAAALAAEVATYVDAPVEARGEDGDRLLVRNLEESRLWLVTTFRAGSAAR